MREVFVLSVHMGSNILPYAIVLSVITLVLYFINFCCFILLVMIFGDSDIVDFSMSVDKFLLGLMPPFILLSIFGFICHVSYILILCKLL